MIIKEAFIKLAYSLSLVNDIKDNAEGDSFLWFSFFIELSYLLYQEYY